MSKEDIHETPSSTPNFRTELAEQLAELVPEAIADGKVDVTKLQELLEEDAADGNERFGLFWPGKKRALRAAQEPTTATLKPDFENSKDWDTTQNVFIEGDNLEVLKILQRHYHGKIKMIYIDPPYNTGQDFVYKDSFGDGVQHYLDWTKQVGEDGKKLSSNSESEGRYHSNWLNMMYPRLKLARNLLTDDGLVFISIDDNEYDNLKKLADLVLGEANHLNTFVWVSNLKGRQISANGAAATKEYILCYARNAQYAPELRLSGARLKALMPAVYKGFDYEVKSDAHGPYVTKNELYNTNSIFNEVTRPNLVFDIYYSPETGDVKTTPVSDQHVHPGWVKISPKANNNGTNLYHAYRWSRPKIERESYNLEFVETPFGWKVFTKVRDVDVATMKDIIMNISTTEGTSDIRKLGLDPKWFDYPKPKNLIKLLIESATDKNSIVLDFFAGSGTTAHAVMEVNSEDQGRRQFIQVQIPEPLPSGHVARSAGLSSISDISVRRIRSAADAIQVQLRGELGPDEGDYGFRTFRLADTSFRKWRSTSDVEAGELEQQLLGLVDSADDEATPDDLLTEILLKQGFSLTERIEPRQVAGLDVRAVLQPDADPAVLAYLDEHVKPSLDQLREMVAEIPGGKIIVLEDAFQGDDELKTNLAQMCKTNNIELWTA